MKVPANTRAKAIGLALLVLVGAEGLSLKSYQDSGGVWTICYGYAQGVKPGQTATKEQCWSMLESEAKAVEAKIAPNMPADIRPNQLAALIDFCYNVGVPTCKGSTLYRYAKNGQYHLVAAQFPRWKYVAGKDCTLKASNCSGIPKRRAAEAALWNQKE